MSTDTAEGQLGGEVEIKNDDEHLMFIVNLLQTN